jgi:hypothetical protein
MSNKDIPLSIFENVEDYATKGMLDQAHKIAGQKEWAKIQAEKEQNDKQFVSTKSIFDDNDTVDEIPQFLDNEVIEPTETEPTVTSITETPTEQPQKEIPDSAPWWWLVLCGIVLFICKCVL